MRSIVALAVSKIVQIWSRSLHSWHSMIRKLLRKSGWRVEKKIIKTKHKALVWKNIADLSELMKQNTFAYMESIWKLLAELRYTELIFKSFRSSKSSAWPKSFQWSLLIMWRNRGKGQFRLQQTTFCWLKVHAGRGLRACVLSCSVKAAEVRSSTAVCLSARPEPHHGPHGHAADSDAAPCCPVGFQLAHA